MAFHLDVQCTWLWNREDDKLEVRRVGQGSSLAFSKLPHKKLHETQHFRRVPNACKIDQKYPRNTTEFDRRFDLLIWEICRTETITTISFDEISQTYFVTNFEEFNATKATVHELFPWKYIYLMLVSRELLTLLGHVHNTKMNQILT